jgi:hypothetical protein
MNIGRWRKKRSCGGRLSERRRNVFERNSVEWSMIEHDMHSKAQETMAEGDLWTAPVPGLRLVVQDHHIPVQYLPAAARCHHVGVQYLLVGPHFHIAVHQYHHIALASMDVITILVTVLGVAPGHLHYLPTNSVESRASMTETVTAPTGGQNGNEICDDGA